MSYSDQKFYSRSLIPWGFATSFGTSTASATDGHDLSDVAAGLPKLENKSKLHAVRFRCTTIPDAGSTGLVAHVMNGTDTVGTAVLTTMAADGWADMVVTGAAYQIMAVDLEPTLNLTGTSTASGDANGAYDIWASVSEEFVA